MPTPEETAAAEAAAAAAQNKPWYDGLDADLKANPSVQKFKDVGSLTKSYLELEKTLGRDKIVIPTEKDGADVHAAFWKKLGAPEKAEDYDVGDEDLPEPVRISKDAKDALRKRAAELGVPKKQFEELFKLQKQLTEKRFNQEVERLKNLRGESEAKLREKFGAGYEAKTANAQKLLDTFGKGKEFTKEFKEVLVNDRGFIEMMAEIAEAVSEDKFGGKQRTSMTPQEAQSELNQIMGDLKGPYYNDLHPEHNAIVDRTLILQQLIEAGQAQ